MLQVSASSSEWPVNDLELLLAEKLNMTHGQTATKITYDEFVSRKLNQTLGSHFEVASKPIVERSTELFCCFESKWIGKASILPYKSLALAFPSKTVEGRAREGKDPSLLTSTLVNTNGGDLKKLKENSFPQTST